jgi:hypothetical protein
MGLVYKAARDRKQALDAVTALGAHVSFTYQFDRDGKMLAAATPTGPIWLRRLLGAEYFDRVAAISIGNKVLDEADLAHFESLTELQHLYVERCLFDDESLSHIARLRQLRHLNLSGTNIGDTGLRHIAGLTRLQSLQLRCTLVTDSGIVHLAHLRSLEHLDLSETYITSAALNQINRLQKLSSLGLANTRITEQALERFRTQLPAADVNIYDRPAALRSDATTVSVEFSKSTSVSPVEAKVTIANTGRQSIRAYSSHPRYPFPDGTVVQLFDSAGRPCKRTVAGLYMMASHFYGGSGAFVVVQKGESHSWTMKLGELYELEPGPHKLAVWGALGDAEISVKEFEFDVTSSN